MDEEEMTEQEEAINAYNEARETLERARARVKAAEWRQNLLPRSKATFEAMSIDVLREHIADLARSHGCATASMGEPFTSDSWRAFRAALAVLAERAK